MPRALHGRQDRTHGGEAKQRITRAHQPMEAGCASGDHSRKGGDDPGQLQVSLGLTEPEHGFAELELHPLRIGLGDHAGDLQCPLSLHRLLGIGEPLFGLGQGDALVGALQPGQRLAGGDPAPEVCRIDSTTPRDRA